MGESEGHFLQDAERDEKIRVDNEQNLIDGHRTERVEVLDQEVQGFTSEEERPRIKVGKMSLSSKQIKEVAGALSLEVLQNEVKN